MKLNKKKLQHALFAALIAVQHIIKIDIAGYCTLSLPLQWFFVLITYFAGGKAGIASRDSIFVHRTGGSPVFAAGGACALGLTGFGFLLGFVFQHFGAIAEKA